MKIDSTDTMIISHLMAGFTIKEIAEKICISVPMVKKRTRKMRLKAGAKNNTELTHWFNENRKLEA
jgi:DNA-binding NarL/FixJ family response regulator